MRAGEQEPLADHDRRSGRVRGRARLPRSVEVGVLRGGEDSDPLGMGHDFDPTVESKPQQRTSRGPCVRYRYRSMLALQAVTPERLAACVSGVTLAEARKVIAQVHRGEPVAASSAVRRTSAEAVRAAGEVPQLTVVEEAASQLDPFVKYLLASGADRFEAVRIPLAQPGRYTACVSSQVGCALACAFCATGRLGLERNLSAWEIVEQVRVIRARLPHGRVHGVVFQGMGEPLANLDAVLDAIAVLTEPCALGIDARAITVCTAGLPGGIRRLAAAAPNVRLAISIGSALPDTRRSLIPHTRAHELADVLAAAARHA